MGSIEVIDINGERQYAKKDWFGWRIVEPIRDPETKQWMWKNLFNKRGIAMLIFVLVLLGFIYLAYQEQLKNYQSVMKNPCMFCTDCQDYARGFVDKINIKNTSLGGLPNINFGNYS